MLQMMNCEETKPISLSKPAAVFDSISNKPTEPNSKVLLQQINEKCRNNLDQ